MSSVLNADESSQLLYAAAGSYFIVNLDEADTCYISQARTVHTSDVPLPAQASAQLTGPWYVSTCDPEVLVTVAVLPGSAGGYTNPVGVQIALAALGLAKDATLTGGSALAQPAVPGMLFASAVNIGAQAAHAIVTPPSAYRLWSAWISYSVLAETSYTDAIAQFFASIQDPSGTNLTGIELAVYHAGQDQNDTIGVQFPGLSLPAGQAVVLNVNSGTVLTGTQQRASAGVMYSIP